MPKCFVNGVELNYKLEGPANANLLTMVHGWTAGQVLFEFGGLFNALSSRVRVLTLDLRGHGDSGKLEKDYSLNTITKDVLELLKYLGIEEQIIILGQSMGGFIATNFALKHPERTKGLILLNTTVRLLDSKEVKGTWDTLIQNLRKDRESTMREVTTQMFYGPSDPSIIDRLIEMSMKTPVEIGIRVFNEILTNNLLDDLGKIEIPALILHGEYDIIPLRQAQAMHERLPNSRLVVIKNCGHLPFIEKPEETQKAMFEFLGSL